MFILRKGEERAGGGKKGTKKFVSDGGLKFAVKLSDAEKGRLLRPEQRHPEVSAQRITRKRKYQARIGRNSTAI